jgi:hypothetical protein
MGLFSKVFGKGKNRCGKCGRSIELPTQLMRIHALDINDFSVSGLAGYCMGCGQYLCDRHLKFIKASAEPNSIEWVVGCDSCEWEIDLQPRAVDPDIERINFIRFK